MQKLIVSMLLVGSFGAVGCSRSGGYDAEASREFRAAWEKRRAGDDAGYRAALADLSKRRGTWAGDRAALDLEVADDKQVDTPFQQLMRKAAALMGQRNALPGLTPTP